MMKIKAKIILGSIALTLVSLSFLSSCTNTFQGVGKDMEHSGQEIQKAVTVNKNS
jgi:predicted small secreted protein